MYQLILTTDPRRRTMKDPEVKVLPDLEFIFEAQVSVDIAAWAAFDQKLKGQAGPALVQIHQAAGLELINSCIDFSATTIDFCNYWRLGIDANALAQAEIRMSDNIVFAEFDKLVQHDETKSLLCRVQTVAVARPSGFEVAKSRYLRIQYDVQPRELEEFMARLEAHVPTFGHDEGWALGTVFIYHSGRGGRAVQLWLVPAAQDLSVFQAALARMPWLRSIRGVPLLRPGTAPLATLLQPTPFDPYVTGKLAL